METDLPLSTMLLLNLAIYVLCVAGFVFLFALFAIDAYHTWRQRRQGFKYLHQGPRPNLKR